jgi:hypothetical protein
MSMHTIVIKYFILFIYKSYRNRDIYKCCVFTYIYKKKNDKNDKNESTVPKYDKDPMLRLFLQ